MPRMPSSSSIGQRSPSWRNLIASQSATTPSTNKYAPRKATSTTSVIPGHTKAQIPNSIPSTPRRATSHQYREILAIIVALLSTAPDRAVDEADRSRGARVRLRAQIGIAAEVSKSVVDLDVRRKNAGIDDALHVAAVVHEEGHAIRGDRSDVDVDDADTVGVRGAHRYFGSERIPEPMHPLRLEHGAGLNRNRRRLRERSRARCRPG